jgi:hypothetical protein
MVFSSGTDVTKDTAAVGDVRSGKTFHSVTDAQKTGTAALGTDVVGATVTALTASSVDPDITKYTAFADGATIVSKTVTTTHPCRFVVVASFISISPAKVTDIERGGVVKTTGTAFSLIGFCKQDGYCCLQYAVDDSAAGAKTFDLVNTSGGFLNVYGATIQIIPIYF